MKKILVLCSVLGLAACGAPEMAVSKRQNPYYGTAVIFIQGQGEEFAVKSIKVHGSCNLTYNVVNSVEGLGKLSGELPAREYYINNCKYSQVRKITVITNKGSSDFTFSNQ